MHFYVPLIVVRFYESKTVVCCSRDVSTTISYKFQSKWDMFEHTFAMRNKCWWRHTCRQCVSHHLCVRSGMSLTILALTNPRIKYRQIPMCLQIFRRTGFSLVTIQALLAGYPRPKSRNLTKIHYLLGCLAGCDESSWWGRKRDEVMRSKERRYLVGDFSKKWIHHSKSKYSLCQCVIVGCLCRLPNQRRPTPHDSFLRRLPHV